MIEAYPLHWPVQKKRTGPNDRKSAQFGKQENVKTSYGSSYKSRKPLTLDQSTRRILKELDQYTRVGHPHRVPRETIIISTNIPVRKDGLPRSGYRKPDDPGVAVYFELDGRPYCLPCDKWDRIEDNLAAVAAHIAAMRGIERWGVGEAHDVYTGFKALPESTWTEAEIWKRLGLIGKPDHIEIVRNAYKHKAKQCHPDAHTGSTQAFQEAYKLALQIFIQEK